MKKIKIAMLLIILLAFDRSFSQTKPKQTPAREVTEEFYDAVFADNTPKALKMLETKFPANYEPKNKITPLQAAIWQNNLALVKALAEGGANINNTVKASAGESNSQSAVEVAAGKGTLEILKYLLQKGGSITTNSAFNTAGFGQFYDCAKLLLLKGANQDKGDIRGKLWVFEQAVRKSDYQVLNALKLNKDEWDSNNYEGETALIIAVKNRNAEMVQYLLKKGVNKNKPETFDAGDEISYGKKPIQIASQMKLAAILKLLK